jgi:hypothetical protein
MPWPSGLVTFTVHLSAVVETLMVICTCVLLRKLTSPEVNVFEPPVPATDPEMAPDGAPG